MSPNVRTRATLGSCEYSALQVALMGADMPCVAYLLTEAGMDGRMRCDYPIKASVTGLAFQGSCAIPIFKMLVARGFDVKSLDEVDDGTGLGTAENLLGVAGQQEDKELLKYFVKRLRLSADSPEVRKICLLAMGAPGGSGGLSSASDALAGTTCSFCHQVEKVKKCTRCHMTSYCSRDCQKRHWNASH